MANRRSERGCEHRRAQELNNKERKIERLIRETKALKAELERLNGGKPIVLLKKDKARLRKAAEKIDPEDLKKISYP